jgi:hypothetical protein
MRDLIKKTDNKNLKKINYDWLLYYLKILFYKIFLDKTILTSSKILIYIILKINK